MEVIQYDELLEFKTCDTPIHIWAVEKLREIATEKNREVVLKKGKMFLISITPEKIVTAAMPLSNIMPVPNSRF